MLYGSFARTARRVYKTFAPYKIKGYVPYAGQPVVYVVHHKNLSGPIHAVLTLPVESHLWVYRVFFDREDCFKQYSKYTFTERFGIPRAFAVPLAWILSRIVPAIMRSFAAIPVYRDSRRILETFRQSQAALQEGNSIIICPDIDYSSSDDQIGDIYTGFLHLEKIYYKDTGKHLEFVPVVYNKSTHCTTLGNPVCFKDDAPFNTQKSQIAKTLIETINKMI